jgi:hypothetical protein
MDLLSAVFWWSEPKAEGKVFAASLSNKLMVGLELENMDEFVSVLAVSVMGSIDRHWIYLDLLGCGAYMDLWTSASSASWDLASGGAASWSASSAVIQSSTLQAGRRPLPP